MTNKVIEYTPEIEPQDLGSCINLIGDLYENLCTDIDKMFSGPKPLTKEQKEYYNKNLWN